LKTSFQSHTLSRKSFLKVLMSGAAGVLSAGSGSPLSVRAAVPQATEPLIQGLTPYIRLYGATAAEIGGNAKLDNLKIAVSCKDSSRIKWNITAPQEGEYDLLVSCAVPGPNFHLEVISGTSSVKSDLKITECVYRSTEDGWYFNFDRKRLDGRLHLTRGINPVTLQVSGTEKDEVVRLRCLEVLPASANAEMAAAEESARTQHASTDWFVKAVHGAMFHWTDFTQPRDGMKKPYAGKPLPHFNEVDECAGVDALVTNRVWTAMGFDLATTLHDVRWGEHYKGEGIDEFVWLFQISGAVPASHLVGGYAGAVSKRQPPKYFRLGGGTLKGLSKPGEVVWSRVFGEHGRLNVDLGRASAISLPEEETKRRWKEVTPQWPIMHAMLHRVTQNQFMARHPANHVNAAYAPTAADADHALAAKATMFGEMGLDVHLCGVAL